MPCDAKAQPNPHRLSYAAPMRRALLLLILLCAAGRAGADPADGLDYGPPVAVAAVPDGRTVSLADGTAVRLSALDIPAGRWRDFARSALAGLLQDRSVSPARLAPPDRHGRVPAQLRREDGAWIQAALLGRGLARVDAAGADPAPALAALLAVEAEARAAGRGLWGDPGLAVRPAEALGRGDLDRFQIVEGRVLQAALVRGRAYLNFGPDPRQDFTVTAEPDLVRRLAGAGQDLTALQGRRIRVRGWLDWSGGPRIALVRMEQIERLD
ncbi:thermonuclease family protein [Inquilinus sp. Marseille-Q2685]|uniref:thermonuclease family protein n=1 Tax=Inquilinus sp. Marseille-Q2685 TaxID=2866581 RepID=UPI001CE4707E|nr:thermonuclease family protein [Inquilinus sp. Marseille-Q2685]